MTHRGPFQPLLFCDSVILVEAIILIACMVNGLRESCRFLSGGGEKGFQSRFTF